MQIQSPKRINSEDFNPDDKDVANKIGNVINIFMEEVVAALSKKISITDNLNQAVVIVDKVNVGALGNLNSPKAFKSGIAGKVQGLQVIRSLGASFTTGQPFIDFRETNGIVKINNVQGLTQDIDYKLYVLVISD